MYRVFRWLPVMMYAMALAWSVSALAQETPEPNNEQIYTPRVIALVSNEIRVLADMLKYEPSSPVQKISPAAKIVLEDTANMVVTVSPNGLWQFRHDVSRIDMFDERCHPDDYELVRQAIDSEQFSRMSVLLQQTQTISPLLRQPDGPERLRASLTAFVEDNSVPQELAETYERRVARALQGLSESQHQSLANSSDYGDYYRSLLNKAISEDETAFTRIANDRDAPTHINDAKIEAVLAEIREFSKTACMVNAVELSVSSKHEDSTLVYTYVDANGEKLFLRIPKMGNLADQENPLYWLTQIDTGASPELELVTLYRPIPSSDSVEEIN